MQKADWSKLQVLQKKYLKGTIWRKNLCARIFVSVCPSFPRVTLSENCSLLIMSIMSAYKYLSRFSCQMEVILKIYITHENRSFAPNGGYCRYRASGGGVAKKNAFNFEVDGFLELTLSPVTLGLL